MLKRFSFSSIFIIFFSSIFFHNTMAYTLKIDNQTSTTFYFEKTLPPLQSGYLGDIQPGHHQFQFTFTHPTMGTRARYLLKDGSVIGGIQIKPYDISSCGDGWGPFYQCRFVSQDAKSASLVIQTQSLD